MKNNKNKKDKFLYVIIICLCGLIIGMFFYFQKRIDDVKKQAEANSTMAITLFKRINKIVELNYLDTENSVYLINPNNWNEILKRETLLSLDDLDNFMVSRVIIRQNTDMGSDDLSEFVITMNILNNATFKDFTNLMYQKINEIFVITNNDTSKVESFKEGKGYYNIESFEEATYNNMYYDYMKTMSDGSTGGPKIKVKILYLAETNQIQIEVNKF